MISSPEIRAQLISNRICKSEDLLGYELDEIAKLESDVSRKFPAQYVEFLRAVGKRAPGYYDGSIVTGSEVLSLNGYFAEELLGEFQRSKATFGLAERADEPWRPPDNSFVFFGHGGYHFWYFICDGTDDPFAHPYKIGEEPSGDPPKRLSEWILDSFAEITAEKAALKTSGGG